MKVAVTLSATVTLTEDDPAVPIELGVAVPLVVVASMMVIGVATTVFVVSDELVDVPVISTHVS
jgi:hypothetical protein